MKFHDLFNRNAVLIIALFIVLFGRTPRGRAQSLVFYEDFEIDHSLDNSYVTNSITGGPPNPVLIPGANLAYLYFDYSTAGIPLSPHSTNNSTHGLKLCANLDSTIQAFPSGISVSPAGFGITENFDMHFDAWFNYNGPFTGGGSGSTQIGGAGYGTAGTNAQVAGTADSIFIGGSTDGNTTSDFRVYSSAHQISYQGGSYRIGSSGTDSTILGDPSSGYVYAGINGSRDSDNTYYVTNFPAQQCP